MVKIKDHGIAQPKTKKEACGSDEKWKLKHLNSRELEDKFTRDVAPQARKKAGSLEPWANLTVKQIKEIVDEVFGDSVHEVTEDGVWVGLVRYSLFIILSNIMLKVNQRLHTWRSDFGQKALDTVNFLIEENRAVLYTKALVAEQMATYLQKVPVQPGSDLHKYAYQYSEWDPETNNPQLDVSVLLYANDFFDYRLIRNLVLIRLSYEHLHWRIWLHSMEMTTLRKRDQSAHSF